MAVAVICDLCGAVGPPALSHGAAIGRAEDVGWGGVQEPTSQFVPGIGHMTGWQRRDACPSCRRARS